jgi:hypothetical protein
MRSPNLAIIAIVVVTAVIGALALTNAGTLEVSIFGLAVSLTSGWLLLAGYLLGVVASLPLVMARLHQEKTADRRLTEWQVQDAKLAASVQTDREKQLEAKIATLEAALNRALKK